jgi:hypothetical protein
MLRRKISKTELEQLHPSVQLAYRLDGHGAYVLEVVGEEDLAGLKAAYERTKSELAHYRAALAVFGDATPEQVRERMARGLPQSRSLAERRAELEAQHKGELDARDAELRSHTERADKLALGYREMVVEREALAAIAAARGVPDLLLPHLKQLITTEQLENGQVVARVVGPDGKLRQGVTVADLLSEWKDSEVFGRAFDRPLRLVKGNNGNGHVVSLTRAEAGNVELYRAARDRARTAGVPLVIVEEPDE